MKPPRIVIVPLALLLAGPALVGAQEQPLAAGTDNVPVPKKKKHVQPVYPREALAEGIRGIVILDLVIDTEGRVADIRIIRSIPGLDEAALAAARQWVYNPVKVDGQLVSVRLTVPITFALKLPEISRAQGIPELRQGVTPPWPEAGGSRGAATADVTLDPDGRIGLARIIEGEEPWSTSLLQALRTWRFRAPPIDASLSFQVKAEFVRGSGGDKGTVSLLLSSLRETMLFDASEQQEPEAVADLEPAPAGGPDTRQDTGALTPTPLPRDAGPDSGAEPDVPVPPDPETAPAPETPAEDEEEPPEGPAPAAPETAPETPARVAEARPDPAAPPQPDPAAPPMPAPAAAPPPIEVLTAAPPPPPPENGISALRGVLLEPGVPDLTRGRRPVSPPFARMAGVGGVVEVEFSVGAGGLTTVQRVNGPELLQPAATQAVESWIFRRTRADRAYLVAVFTYEDDLASAVVRPQPPP